MKKIMSRILIIFIIVITLFEFTFSPNVSYAALEFTDEFINSLVSLMGGMVAYGIWLKRLILLGISTVFNGFMSTSFAACCGVNEGFSVGIATPYSIFFNKYKLFDVNFFDLSENTENGPIISIRMEVAEWFYIIRNISSAVLLCILIYVGIRMALSTVAEEKAKYKKMFFDWACSLALIYVLQYIIMFTVYSNNAIVKALKEMYKGTDMGDAILQIAVQAIMPVGISSIVATLVYCMIVFQTIAFMISYTQRMLKTGFLILISPLISITYSIDKMGDGKAQALNSWLKEFVYTILIQPFHCLIYMAFVTTAVKLLGESTIIDAIIDIIAGESLQSQLEFNQLSNGVLVILCLKFINDGEKAIRKIFNFQDDGNLTSMAAGAMVGVAVLKNAQNIGSSAISGMNSAKDMYSRFAGTAKSDFSRFKNSDIGKKFADSKIGKGISDIADKASKTKSTVSKTFNNVKEKTVGKWVPPKDPNKKTLKQRYLKWSKDKHEAWGIDGNDKNQNKHIRGAKSWLRKQVPTAQNLKNALPGALGMMGAAMSYAAGDSGVMEALGVGATVQKNSEDYFSSTLGTMAEDNKRAGDAYEDSKLGTEKNNRSNAIKSSAKTDEAKKRYATEEDRQKVVDQYIKDEESLKLENLPADEKAKIDERRDQLKEDGVLEAVKARAELEGEGGEKFKEDVRKKRIADDSLSDGAAAYGPKAIETKGKEIIKLLEEYKKTQAEHESTENSNVENNLGDEAASSPEKMFDTLKNTINRSVVYGSGGSFDASDMMQKELGLHDDGSDEYQNVVKAVLAYREMVANDNLVGVHDRWKKLNGSSQTLNDATYR